MTDYTRRTFIRVGTTAATAVGINGLTTVSAQQSVENDWQEVDGPTESSLNDAVNTDHGPLACGNEGNVVARTQSEWEYVVEYGPQARSRSLYGIDATDDGDAVWFVGESGVIGEYNLATQTLTNYSAPMGMTSTWQDCAVQGNAGANERLYFVNGSGELLVGVRQDSGAVQYNEVLEPGGGSTIPGIDFHTREQGHVCSTSQFVAETRDEGETWEQIGIDFAGSSFFDIASRNEDDVNVAAGPGIIYRYDGFRWTPHVVSDERQAIRTVTRDGAEGLAAGNGGKVYDRQSVGQWQQAETPSNAALNGVAQAEALDVAVGAGGTIVERQTVSTDAEETDTAMATEEPATPAVIQTLPEEALSVEQYVEGDWVSGQD